MCATKQACIYLTSDAPACPSLSDFDGLIFNWNTIVRKASDCIPGDVIVCLHNCVVASINVG